MKKDDVDLPNALVWIPDSKTASGVAEVPLTDVAEEAFSSERRCAFRRSRTPFRGESEQDSGLIPNTSRSEATLAF